MPGNQSEMNKEFWLLSRSKCRGKPIYDLFSYKGYSLWWSFRYYPMKSPYGILEGMKEEYKDFANRNWRFEKPGIDEPKADIILFDVFIKRSGHEYFGFIPKILEKNNTSVLKTFVYTPTPLQLFEIQKQDEHNRHLFSFMDKNIESKVRAAKKDADGLRKMILGDDEFNSYLDKSFNSKKIRVIRSFIEKACKFYYPRGVAYVELFDAIMRKTKAKVFCDLSHMGVLEYPSAIATRLNGIQRAWVFHGIYTPWKCGVPDEFSEKTIGKSGILLPDMVFAYGNKEIEELVSSGFRKDRVMVGGCPRYDTYGMAWNFLSREKIIKRLGLKEKKHYILWATDAPLLHFKKTDEGQLIADRIFKALKILGPEYGIIIKKHWFDRNEKRYKNLMKQNPDVHATMFGAETPILQLFKIADLVLIKTSTVGMEAIAFNKPIALMQFEKTLELSYYAEYGFPIARDVEELVQIIRSAYNKSEVGAFQKKRERFLKDRLAHFGDSSRIIAAELQRMAAEAKKSE